jgi:hypothetical protein
VEYYVAMGNLVTTARITGACYLALAIAGALGFLVVRPAIHVPHDAAATARNIVATGALPRVWLSLELLIVLAQALTAVAFYKLFRGFNAVAAGATGAFGLVNAVAILASAACIATGLKVAAEVALAPGGDQAATVQLLFEASSSAWGVAALFFGLWLIPMGYVLIATGIMPKALGWTLALGGVGYVISGFVSNGLEGPPRWLVDGLTIPASIGEFWMIGYLLIFGIRPSTADADRSTSVT